MKIHSIIIFLVLVFITANLYSQEEIEEDTDTIERTNWFIYLYQNIGSDSYSRAIPLYSYNRNSDQAYDEYFLWPLLIGYETKQNLYPEEMPFTKQFRWYSFPIMTLAGETIAPHSYTETNTLVSFSLLSFYQHRHVAEKYLSTSWFSLPGLSYYNRQILTEKDLEIDHISLGSPFSIYNETIIKDHKKIYLANYWALDPTFIILGTDSFKFLSYANWGKDSAFSFLSVFHFSVFEIFTHFYQYPGARYDHFSDYQNNWEKGTNELYNTEKSPFTRFAMFSPMIQVESTPDGHFSWQFLPLFYYLASEQKYQFSILPLGLNFTNEGIHFAPIPKLFPFVYHDEVYNRWDILWPLIQYENNPAYPKISLKMRFLFEYKWQKDTEGNNRYNFNIAQQFLFDYTQDEKQKVVEVLPFGILFSYFQNDNGYQWRLLGFGYAENKRKNYLQVLFFNLPIGTKN